MRAPPPPRKSRSNIIIIYAIRIKSYFRCQRIRKRWNAHKLKRLQYKKLQNNCLTPASGLRVEDTFNIPTQLLPKSSRTKPLLIASFCKGCDNTPQLELLQKTKIPRRIISKRKYRLKYFDGCNLFKNETTTINDNTMTCARTVHSIKQATSQRADVRLIFHNKNIIKTLNIKEERDLDQVYFSDDSPILEFDHKNLINLRNFKSLREFSRQSELRVTGSSRFIEEIEMSSSEYSDIIIDNEVNNSSSNGNGLNPSTSKPRLLKYTESYLISYSKS